MESLLNNFTVFLSNNIWLALIAAFAAGIVSSFSPCILTSLPLLIGYVGGYAGKDKKTALKYSIIFSLGITATFTVLGALSALLGRLLTGAGKWWYLILGLIMLLAGLQMIGVIEFKGGTMRVPSKKKGMAGAFFLGILGGILSSPCSTPVLAAILAFVASEGNIVLGVIMLLLYSIGHSLLILIAGTSVGIIDNLNNSAKTRLLGKVLKIILSLVIFAVGLYLIYLGV